ncbi:MAG: hypothetical protein H0V14_01895 [Chitinophagaceae bacterium]|nr:hypothetical protein [Chitinophagaceae bacterium]
MNPKIFNANTSFVNQYKSSSSFPLMAPVIFVWTIWAIMLLVALACIFIYGRNIPLAEDWHMVAPLTGNEPNLAKWLWLQNNEHRIPLPKFILLLLLKITHGDFRCGMFLTVLSVGFIAAALIKVSNYVRGGKTNYSDAFFPIALLHIGNWENFFWTWQFTFILPTILTLILLAVIIQYKNLLRLPMAIVAAVCTISLPLSGANGLMYAMPAIPLLAYEGFLHFRSKKAGASKGIGLLLISAVIITVLIVIAYFIGYERPYWYPPSPGIITTLKTSAKFMALGLGPVAASSWGISTFIVLILVSSTGMLLLFAVLKTRGAEFRRAVGLLFFLGGYIIFALAMGYGRATMVPTIGLPMRYVLLAVPTLIICYCSWELYGLPTLKKVIHWGLFLILSVVIFNNTLRGLGWRNYYLKGTDSVINDIKQGVPHSLLAARHQNFLLHWNKQMLLTGMKQLKQSGMGPFKYMKDDPPNDNLSAENNERK